MKKIILLLLSSLLMLTGCVNDMTQEDQTESNVEIEVAEEVVEINELAPYRSIEPEEANENLASEEEILLLDVRTESEYNDGHIPEAVLLPLDKIFETVESKYPDKEQMIYVYCRSGRRSKASAAILLDLGYQNVYDLGGIINWPYEIE